MRTVARLTPKRFSRWLGPVSALGVLTLLLGAGSAWSDDPGPESAAETVAGRTVAAAALGADALDAPVVEVDLATPGPAIGEMCRRLGVGAYLPELPEDVVPHEERLLDGRPALSSISPGEAPEGDYLGWAAFTRDGERVLITNRETHNVTVFDWETMGVTACIPVGRFPTGIAVTDDYAVVACTFSDEVWVIDLADLTIAAVVATGGEPCVVRTSPDGRRAFVACDASNTCEVVDLGARAVVGTIPNFPVGLYLRALTLGHGRWCVKFTGFEVSPDGEYVIAGDWENSVLFFNTSTGGIDHAVPGIVGCRAVGLSGDGTTLVAASGTSPPVLHRISLSTRSETGRVTLTGWEALQLCEVAVNADGSKALVAGRGCSAIVRFETSDFTILDETETPGWIGTSPDHHLVISGQEGLSIVDFAAEAVVGQCEGAGQRYGAVSPVGHRVAAFDPLRHEGLYFCDYQTPGGPAYRGTTSCGLEPEGDAPWRVAISPDGTKAVVTNVLSGNATIIDLETRGLLATLPIADRVAEVAITSDSRWAVVCGMESNAVMIVDLDACSVVAVVPTGLRPGVVCITPDDTRAYVGNLADNTVSAVDLKGALSAKVAEIPCGIVGVLWWACGVFSDIEMSPAGDHLLVAASFSNQVDVIDVATNRVVSSIEVGEFPIQIAFNGDGSRAVVTNLADHSYSVIDVKGASSSLVGTFATGEAPLRLSYNPVRDLIGVGNCVAQTVSNVDPETGGIVDTDEYLSYGGVTGVLFDECGRPVVLTGPDGVAPSRLHVANSIVPLPAFASHFDYNCAAGIAAVVMPGPDFLTIVRLDRTTGVDDVRTVHLPQPAVVSPARPNPFREQTTVGFSLTKDERVRVSVYDVLGRCVAGIADGMFGPGDHHVVWDGTGSDGGRAAAGVYFVSVRIGAGVSTVRATYLR